MSVDLLHNGFNHLVLAVTATMVGTFHSPIPLDSPVLHEHSVAENKIYHSSQEVLPAPNPATNNVLGVGKNYEKSIPMLSPTASPTLVVVSTISPSSTTVPTSKPTATQTPTIAPRQNSAEVILDVPLYTPVVAERSLNPDTMLQLINQHRERLQLPHFVKDDQLCKVAEYRKPQLYDEIFTNGNVHKGFYDLNLPYYITENMAHYGSEQAILNWWLGSSVHRAAIEGNSKYSCGACAGNSCAQLFTNYTPKSQ